MPVAILLAAVVGWRVPEIQGRDFRPGFNGAGYWTTGGEARRAEARKFAPCDYSVFRDCALRQNAYRGGQLVTVQKDRRENMRYYAKRSDKRVAPVENYRIEDLFGPKDRASFLENPRPDVPFVINVADVRPAFFLLDELKPDKAAYEAWKAKTPNFMGFEMLNEFDSDSSYYCRGVENVPDEDLRKRFLAKYPLPRDQYEWIDQMRKCRDSVRRALFDEERFWTLYSGCYSLGHIGAMLGASGIEYEATGQEIGRWQHAMAYTRGAARQWGIPFCWYMAHCSTCFTREGKRITGDNNYTTNGCNHAGISRSLFNRQFVYGWLGGASWTSVELWWMMFSKPGPDGRLVPSEYLEDYERQYRMMQKTDRGVAYTPLCLLVPVSERVVSAGVMGTMEDAYSQNQFLFTLTPIHADDLLYRGNHARGEEGCLYNSPFADFYDMLVPDAGQPSDRFLDALSKYRVAFLVGGFRRENVDTAALRRYVEGGGTLVVSADRVRDGLVDESLSGVGFDGMTRPSSGLFEVKYAWMTAKPGYTAAVELADRDGTPVVFSHRFGRGRVVTVAARRFLPAEYQGKLGGFAHYMEEPYGGRIRDAMAGRKTFPLVKWLLEKVQKATLPVEVEGDVQWGVNIVDNEECTVNNGGGGVSSGNFLLWLINNRGVRHFAYEEAVVDPKAVAEVRVRIAGSKSDYRISVPPGEFRLLELAINAEAEPMIRRTGRLEGDL